MGFMMNSELYRLKILILDDDPFFGNSLRTLLDCQGAEVELRVSVPDAIAKLETEIFDIVILDFQLGGSDGLSVARQIRSSQLIVWPQVPLIGLTGNDDPKLRELSRQSGMNSLFVKPSGLDELFEELKKYVQKRLSFPLDEKATSRFRAMDPSGSVLLEMVELFRKTSATYLSKMKEALRKNDRDQIREEAHKMKSSSRLLGAFLMGETCEFLEKNSASLSANEIRKNLGELERLRGYLLEDLSKLS